MKPNFDVFIGLIILSFAIFCATRIAYGRFKSGDGHRLGLNIACHLLFVVGATLALCGYVTAWAFIYFVVAAVSYLILAHSHRQAEHLSFMWTLTQAVDKRLPLPVVAESFNWQRDWSAKRSKVVEHLKNGASVVDALELARFPLQVDQQLAMKVGVAVNDPSLAYRQLISQVQETHNAVHSLAVRLYYYLFLTIYGLLTVTFLLLKIVPVYAKMFQEYEMELPSTTLSLISLATNLNAIFVLGILPLGILTTVVLLLVILYTSGLLPRDVPLVSRLGILLDRSRVLRSLSLFVQQSHSIHFAIESLSTSFPKSYVRRKLSDAAQRIDRGESWIDALKAVRLISPADAVILASAERAGNLPWALKEMADSVSRRFIHWIRWAQSCIFPMITLLFGLMVAFISIGMFLPLVSVIQGLS